MSSCSSTTSSADKGGCFMAITTAVIPRDIVRTHILTRLDGPSLASTSCVSSQLHLLSTEEKLWRDICNSTWPSTKHPYVNDIISLFPAGHRSFFSDAFPTLPRHYRPLTPKGHPKLSELISAIDIHYNNKVLFSKIHVIEAVTQWFLSPPLYIDLELKENVPMPVKFGGDEEACRADLEENMTLSWIVIDQTHKRAMNLSSLRPVSVHRHWLTKDFQFQYATILGSDCRCSVTVMCGEKEGSKLHVKEVIMQVDDMNGKVLSEKEGLVMLQEAMANGRRKRGNREDERESYEDCLKMSKERKVRKEWRNKFTTVCLVTSFTIFLAFWTAVMSS